MNGIAAISITICLVLIGMTNISQTNDIRDAEKRIAALEAKLGIVKTIEGDE